MEQRPSKSKDERAAARDRPPSFARHENPPTPISSARFVQRDATRARQCVHMRAHGQLWIAARVVRRRRAVAFGRGVSPVQARPRAAPVAARLLIAAGRVR